MIGHTQSPWQRDVHPLVLSSVKVLPTAGRMQCDVTHTKVYCPYAGSRTDIKRASNIVAYRCQVQLPIERHTEQMVLQVYMRKRWERYFALLS